MAIKTHRKNAQIVTPNLSGTVWKGNIKPGSGAGRTLEEKLRFSGRSSAFAGIIKAAYNGAATAKATDVIVDYLTVFAYDNSIEKTFVSRMGIWAGTRVVRVCDRDTVTALEHEGKDLHGQPLFELKKVSQPCPLRNVESLGVACPHGCKQEATFYFYIPELINGYGDNRRGITSMPCALTTHSWLDIVDGGIGDQLQAIADEFGSITWAPDGFQFGQFGNRIPLILSRYKATTKRPEFSKTEKITGAGKPHDARTGKKAPMDTWPLSIVVDPIWRQAYYAWQRSESIQRLGYRPDPKLLQAAGLEIIEATVVTESAPSLPPAPEDWRGDALNWAVSKGVDSAQANAIISGSRDKTSCFRSLQPLIERATPFLVGADDDF